MFEHAFFGPAVADLDDATGARWLMVAGAASAELQALLAGAHDDKALRAALAKAGARATITVSLAGARRAAALMQREPERQRVLASLPGWWEVLANHGGFAVQVTGDGGKLHRGALVDLLVEHAGASSAWFSARRPGAGLWEWPLRVGVPAEANDLFDTLSRARYGELFTVERVGFSDAIVDLLLLPGELHQAVDAVPSARTVADAVLVLGDTHTLASRTAANMDALARRYRSGLVGLCRVHEPELQPWFQATLRELSHNRGLPAALFTARLSDQRLAEGGTPGAADFAPPVLSGDAGFIAGTFIADAARRLADSLQGNADDIVVAIDPQLLGQLGLEAGLANVREFGRRFNRRLPGLQWINEGGDATTLVRVRRALEQQLGRIDSAAPVALPSSEYPWKDWSLQSGPPPGGDDFAMAAPPGDEAPAAMAPDETAPDETPHDAGAGEAPSEPRYVHAQVAAPDAAQPPAQPVRLEPGREYRVHVHIGADRGGDIVRANVALDESQLPESDQGHDLTLAWVPLSEAMHAVGGRARPAPESATLHLPRTGDTATVAFTLHCGEHPQAFRARLLVLHENRVLQTLLMTADADGRYALAQENVYAPGFTSGSRGVPADIAIVVNDNPQGVSGITTIAGASVDFHEPAGMKAALAALRKAVGENVVAAVGAEDATLGSADNLRLMIRLAKHGATILGEIEQWWPEVRDVAGSARVQVVEAVTEAFFPVEFLYSGPSPRPDAALCPNAAAALASGGDAVHAGCAHRDSSRHVCPAAFWGLSKCIERHAHAQTVHRLAVPTPGEECIGPFQSALVAASQIAEAEMKGPAGVPAQVGKFITSVTQAASWDDWEAGIAQHHPDLLLLLPHTGVSTADPSIPSLEISSKYLDADNIEALHVRAAGHPRPGPLVMLLGCHTSAAQVDFLASVARFLRNGAPVVVGTLSVIHATQAGLLASRLLAATTAPGHVATRFDEALLQVKRELLAAGHGVAFTLVAYGHSSWRL